MVMVLAMTVTMVNLYSTVDNCLGNLCVGVCISVLVQVLVSVLVPVPVLAHIHVLLRRRLLFLLFLVRV